MKLHPKSRIEITILSTSSQILLVRTSRPQLASSKPIQYRKEGARRFCSHLIPLPAKEVAFVPSCACSGIRLAVVWNSYWTTRGEVTTTDDLPSSPLLQFYRPCRQPGKELPHQEPSRYLEFQASTILKIRTLNHSSNLSLVCTVCRYLFLHLFLLFLCERGL